MNIVLRIVGKLLRWDKAADEYWQRFIRLQMEYALSIGMPTDTLSDLTHRAINEADGVCTFPGTLLRDFIAEWEENNI